MESDKLSQLMAQRIAGSEGVQCASAMTKAVQDKNINFMGIPLGTCLAPCVLTQQEFNTALARANSVLMDMQRLAGRIWSDKKFFQVLGINPMIQSVMHAADESPSESFARFDGLFDENGEVSYIEYNPMPAGVILSSLIAEIMTDLPVIKEYVQAGKIVPKTGQSKILPTLKAIFKRKMNRETGRLGILIDPSVAHRSITEESVIVNILMRGGFQVDIVPFAALQIENDGIYQSGNRIDCLVCNDPRQILANFPAQHRIWSLVRSRKLWFLDSLSNQAIRGSKALFALMSEPLYEQETGIDIQQETRRSIPWTRIFGSQTATGFDGQIVELFDFALENKDELVIKPFAGFGGHGVTLGWTIDSVIWRARLDESFNKGFVIQRRIHNKKREFPIISNAKATLSNCYWDFAPFVFDGRHIEGALSRLSENALLNVSQGNGNIVPIFVTNHP